SAHFERYLTDDGVRQGELVVEIDVERARGDAGGAGDLAHAGAVKAKLHEDLAGAVEDLAAFRGLLVADQMKGSAVTCNHWFSFSASFQFLDMYRQRAWSRLDLIYLDRTVRSMLI